MPFEIRTQMRRKSRAVTSLPQIMQLMRSIKVCRLALPDQGHIYLVPLSLGFICDEQAQDMTLYFHSAKAGRKIDIIRAGIESGQGLLAAFEMDGHYEVEPADKACQYSAEFHSIMGEGLVDLVTDTEEKLLALQCIMQQQTGRDGKSFEFGEAGVKSVEVIRVKVQWLSCKERAAMPG